MSATCAGPAAADHLRGQRCLSCLDCRHQPLSPPCRVLAFKWYVRKAAMWCCEDRQAALRVAKPASPAWCHSIAAIWRWEHWEACFARRESTRKRLSMSSDAFHRGTRSCTCTAATAAPRSWPPPASAPSTTPPAAQGCSSTASRKPAATCASNTDMMAAPAPPPNRSCASASGSATLAFGQIVRATKAVRASGRWRGGISVAGWSTRSRWRGYR